MFVRVTVIVGKRLFFQQNSSKGAFIMKLMSVYHAGCRSMKNCAFFIRYTFAFLDYHRRMWNKILIDYHPQDITQDDSPPSRPKGAYLCDDNFHSTSRKSRSLTNSSLRAMVPNARTWSGILSPPETGNWVNTNMQIICLALTYRLSPFSNRVKGTFPMSIVLPGES